MQGLQITELEQCERAYIEYRTRLKELNQKPVQWQNEEHKQAIRFCKAEIKKLKATIKSFQLPLF